MARATIVFNGLLSCPRGMERDREAARQAISEVNALLRPDGISLDAKDWETDVRPTIGADPQSVVNSQICKDADLALVFVSDRVGSPTPRARSGTIEEVEAILSRKESGENVDLMVYFRKPRINLSTESLKDLEGVLQFRDSLGSRGVFWKEYEEYEELATLIRVHLPGSLRELRINIGGASPLVPADGSKTESQVEVDLEEELGSIDLEIAFMDAVQEVNESLARISTVTEKMTAGLGEEAAVISELAKPNARDPRKIRDSANRATEYIEEYNDALEAETPKIRENYGVIRNSLVAIVGMYTGGLSREGAEMIELRSAVENSSSTGREAMSSIVSHRDALSSMPSITKELNVQKRRGVILMDDFLDAVHTSVRNSEEVLLAIDARPKDVQK